MLRILITALVTLALAALAIVGTGRFQEKKAREVTIKVTREMYKDWDFEAVKDSFVTEFRENREFVEGAPKMLRWGQEVLGPLEHLGAPTGGLAYRWGPNVPSRGFVGHYEFNARFSRGEAKLEVEMLRESGEWRLSSFRFNSPKILERMQKQGNPFEHGSPPK